MYLCILKQFEIYLKYAFHTLLGVYYILLFSWYAQHTKKWCAQCKEKLHTKIV